jgi:exodeoxyribonuclease VII large subunit
MAGRLAGAEGELQTAEHHLSAASPAHRLDGWEAQLRSLRERSRKAVEYQLLAKQNALGRAAASLEALSPLRVLARGYTLTSKNGRAVSDPSTLRRGDLLETRFAGGTVQSTVTDIHLLTTDPQPDRS